MKEFSKLASLHNFIERYYPSRICDKCYSILNEVKKDMEVSIMKMTIAAGVIQWRRVDEPTSHVVKKKSAVYRYDRVKASNVRDIRPTPT